MKNRRSQIRESAFLAETQIERLGAEEGDDEEENSDIAKEANRP